MYHVMTLDAMSLVKVKLERPRPRVVIKTALFFFGSFASAQAAYRP